MASKKTPRFTVGPDFRYWPIYDVTRIVALCPNMSEAQAVAAALNASEKRSNTR